MKWYKYSEIIGNDVRMCWYGILRFCGKNLESYINIGILIIIKDKDKIIRFI